MATFNVSPDSGELTPLENLSVGEPAVLDFRSLSCQGNGDSTPHQASVAAAVFGGLGCGITVGNVLLDVSCVPTLICHCDPVLDTGVAISAP